MALAGQTRRAASCGAVVLKHGTSFGNCDPAVIRHPLGIGRKAGIVCINWSGAGDLNSGPHGPELWGGWSTEDRSEGLSSFDGGPDRSRPVLVTRFAWITT